jgi:AbrB family looped-hinge helix DNA binding protein
MMERPSEEVTVMARATVSPKFQIVIPKEIRERYELKPGQQLALIDRGGYIALVPQRPLSELRGILKGAPLDGYRDKTDRY